MDTYVTVGGDALNYRGRIGACGGSPASPNWMQRLDLNMSGDIDVTGDVWMFVGMIGEDCT